MCLIIWANTSNSGTYRICAPLNFHTGVSRGTRGLNFGQCLHLHSYFVYASSECSGESAHMHRLT